MPAYFRFLTVMAFNVFLREKVHMFVCCERLPWFHLLFCCVAGGCGYRGGGDWRDIRLN